MSRNFLRSLQALDDDARTAWTAAALQRAWEIWQPVLAAAAGHDVAALAAQIATAQKEETTAEEAQQALHAWNALPTLGPPPPYSGHFYAAVKCALMARYVDGAPRLESLQAALAFCCVRPDGSEGAPEIRALKPSRSSRRRRRSSRR